MWVAKTLFIKWSTAGEDEVDWLELEATGGCSSHYTALLPSWADGWKSWGKSDLRIGPENNSVDHLERFQPLLEHSRLSIQQ